MARWKILVAHYLNTTIPAEWEYMEQSGGDQKRRRFTVPRLLDPKDPKCWTNKWGTRDDPDGEIIVCVDGKGAPGDIAFLGDPTPDMIPMDDEAREISAGFATRWSYKPESGEQSYSQSLIDTFQSVMAEKQAAPQTVQIEGLSDLVAAMAAQSKAVEALVTSQTRRI